MAIEVVAAAVIASNHSTSLRNLLNFGEGGGVMSVSLPATFCSSSETIFLFSLCLKLFSISLKWWIMAISPYFTDILRSRGLSQVLLFSVLGGSGKECQWPI